MKLTRAQEIALINIGLQTLLNGQVKEITPRPKRVVKKRSHKWSDAQRAKFSKSMKARWAEWKKERK